MLACQPSTAKLAVSYLSWCPTHGADAAEILLESLPVGGMGGVQVRVGGGVESGDMITYPINMYPIRADGRLCVPPTRVVLLGPRSL